MTPRTEPVASAIDPRRRFPLLLLLFFGSGCAALIYEVVWFQLLQLVIGSSALSLAVLLGTFMGGMCLGSLLLARVVSSRHHPLRVYAVLEAGIALAGVVVLLGMPVADRVYVAVVGHGLPSVVLRAVVCAVFLLPPTLLMGATLPAIARWVETTPRGVAWMGFFYGGNIAGAVAGCLLAGFYLLRIHDLATATAAAVALNILVAAAGWLLARSAAYSPPGHDAVDTSINPPHPVENRVVYWVIGLSGLCALGAQVVWTRLLSLLLGGTVYTFSIILAVFLIGLGLGSGLGSLVARGLRSPRAGLGAAQFLAACGLIWTAFMIARSLPLWPVDLTLTENPWARFQLDLVRCAWAVLPATIAWGASFPLALSAVVSPGRDAAPLVARVYAANTLGAIAGALVVSLLLIPWIGTQQTQRVLVGAALLGGLLAVAPVVQSLASSRVRPPRIGFVLVAAALAVAGWAWVPPLPDGLVTYGRRMLTRQFSSEVIYVGEGMNASVAVSQSGDWRYFHVSGKVEASTDPADMRLQRMLGHMPALLHPRPRSVLIVGCGAGVTAGSFIVHPDVERIVICEIEPLIPRVVAEYFGPENYDLLKDPRVEVVYDDARHYILTTDETFDVITSDPIHPWVKGAAVLYTREYFELCRQRLNPGGIISQWVPLYESSPAVVQSEIATFFDVFPEGTIWSNDIGGEGYDTIMIGQSGPLSIDASALQTRFVRPDHAWVRESVAEVGFHSAFDLLRTYAGQKSDLTGWLADAEINREKNLRLMYLAGLGSDIQQAPEIFNEILSRRSFPDQLFATTPAESLTRLKLMMEAPYEGAF